MARPGEIAVTFLKLGCTSFGGPVAHLGYLRAECVERRRWLDEAAYADLVALCQFLPGPASSQLVFALGSRRGGLAGAVTASLCFTLPSAVLMIALAYGVGAHAGWADAGWVRGLKLAAVAVVAQAVWSMGRSLCPDWPRRGLAIVAAAVLGMWTWPVAPVVVIAVGGVVGWWWARHDATPERVLVERSGGGQRGALLALVIVAVLLVGLPMIGALSGHGAVDVFGRFYRAGALVFGGGHVVLPLLRAELVPSGYVADGPFMTGYAAAQALPGPLFTFAGYLGAVMEGTPGRWLGGCWALLAIFLPGWLLVGGALPFWERLKTYGWMRGAVRGMNAAVVGVLLAALVGPVWHEGVHTPWAAALGVVAFGGLVAGRWPVWAVVGALALFGAWSGSGGWLG